MDIVYATVTTNITTPDGGRHIVRGGSHWPADDPVVKIAAIQAPGLFVRDPRYGLAYSTPPKEMAEPPVETVTAGPGEKRAQVRRG